MARPLFDFAAVPWPPTDDIAVAWGATDGGQRLVGAVVGERSGVAMLLHGPVVRAATEALEIASQLVAAVLDHAVELEAGVVVLARRKRYQAEAFRLDVAEIIVGRERLF